jgi:Kef-type K+ transport system membrane component KefB
LHAVQDDGRQIVIAAASTADSGTVVLLSLFFSREATSVWSTLLLLGGFVLLAAAVGVAIAEVGHWRRLEPVLRRLQDSSAQIRVRGALLLLVGFAALAQLLGLEVILGAFIAGALLRLLDRDRMMTHPLFHQKLDAAGFGVFIPFFFVVSGMELDLPALFHNRNHGSMIRSWLVELMERGFEEFGDDLGSVEPYVEDAGERVWGVRYTMDKEVPIPLLAQVV